jgi:hypothetical protein
MNPDEQFTDKRGNRMINKASLVWVSLIGLFLITLTNWNTYERGKSAGYWGGYHDGFGAGLTQGEAEGFKDGWRAGHVTAPPTVDKEDYTKGARPVIIGPSPDDAPGVALYVDNMRVKTCFSFGNRKQVQFTGFLNNNGTVSPTASWMVVYC